VFGDADNIYNKKALNILVGGEGHWALAASQLLVGVLFVLPLWILGIRKRPDLTLDNWKALAPIGVFNAAAHGASVLALGAGKSVFRPQIFNQGYTYFKDVCVPF